jgi:uncharacterized protein (UPF0332 family)
MSSGRVFRYESRTEKAQRSLKGAKLMVENALPELAVSRAYYAMFYFVASIKRFFDSIEF